MALVGQLASKFAMPFGADELGKIAGLLHDIGKMSVAFQDYIRGNGATKGPDHATAGAKEAVALYGDHLGRMLAYCIAGHHSGLADYGIEHNPGTLAHRLKKSVEVYTGWEIHAGALSGRNALAIPDPLKIKSQHEGFDRAFFIRMLFSALVDADFLATEQFYAEAVRKAGEPDETPRRGMTNSLETLRSKLDAELNGKANTDTEVNKLRGHILSHVRAQGSLTPGLFSLTVPTGGGKTLTSLAFALDHAIAHGLDRIVYVIPYTSIIEQTADVFRGAVGDEDVLEHHSAVEWDPHSIDDDEGREGLKKLRHDAENWDVRIIVTTSVQFFESLFAARTSACRKLHNLAKSVIILDEAQTIPLNLLMPCLAAVETLATSYGSSVVLCTATQPALSKSDDFKNGLENVRELSPNPQHLYTRLKRVRVNVVEEPIDDTTLAAQLRVEDQVLCIVNNRTYARDLFGQISDVPGARHLTTLMCPLHRRAALKEIRQDLKDGKPVRLIATSLIEAGVDVDFPTVWRAEAGLDSIAQAAGRCNREGKLVEGVVNVFRPFDVEGRKSPPALQQLIDASRDALRHYGDDPIGLEAIRAYFKQLYWMKGDKELDAARLNNAHYSIMNNIRIGAGKFAFPFAEIATAFRFIDDVMLPVIIRYDSKVVDDLVESLKYVKRPGAIARKLALYSVPVPRDKRTALISSGAARIVEPEKYDDQFVILENNDLYSSKSGLNWEDNTFRSIENNLI